MNPLRYRPIDHARDTDAFVRLMQNAYGSSEALARLFLERGGDRWRVLAPEDGPPCAALVLPLLGQWFGARPVSMTGVAGVAVSPEARGGGAATRLMHEALREIHAEGTALSALYPATQPVYRRAGYEQAGATFECTLSLRDLRPAREDRELPIRPFHPDDLPRLEDAWRAHAPTINGALARETYAWPRVLSRRDEPASGWIVEHAGQIEGWAFLLRAEHANPGHPHPRRELIATDLVARTHRAARRLLAFLADHASMVAEVRFDTAPACPLLMLVPEQRYRLTLVDHWMLRIVSVERALSQRGYPSGLTASLLLRVRDHLLPGNNGLFSLTVADGAGHAARLPDDHAPAQGKPLIDLDIRALAALYSGFMNAQTVARTGLLQATPGDEALAAASALFAAPTPTTAHRF